MNGRATEFALLGLLALLWGSSYLLIKVALDGLPPLTLIAARVTIAAVFLTTILRLRGGRLPTTPRHWRLLFVQSLLNSIVAWTLLAWGQQHIDSGLASVLNSTAPIFVFLITLLFTRHEPASALRLTGAMMGLGGVVLIVGTGALDGLGKHMAGQLAVLGSAILYAGAAIWGRRFADISATATAAGTMIWATVVLVPVSLIVDEPWTLSPGPTALAATAALGIGSTGIALLLYFRLVRTLGSLGVASQAYLRAGVGVVLGIALLGEQFTLPVALGLVVAIAGVALINSRPVQ